MTRPSYLEAELRLCPQMQAEDWQKHCFQGWYGVGHALAEVAEINRRIITEAAAAESWPAWDLQPLWPDGFYIRVSLRLVANGLVSADHLAGLFARTGHLPPRGLPAPSYPAFCGQAINPLMPGQIPSHSPLYRKLYHPHYRVIAAGFVPLLGSGQITI